MACSTIRRLIDEEAYDPACLTELTFRFADYIHKGARTKPIDARITVPAAARTDPNPIATNFVPRGVKLAAKDFENYDRIAGCPGCMHPDSGRSGSRNHRADCRQHVEGLLAQDDEGRRRLTEANGRRDAWIA